MRRLILILPGQGSQFPGMCAGLYARSAAARLAVEEVDAALGERLSATMLAGPAGALARTATTQPALLAHSVASWRALCEALAARGAPPPLPAAGCGHSVGEYAALVAAGALALADAARLLRLRGQAMQAAADAADGNGEGLGTRMVALLFGGAEGAAALEARVRAACAEAQRAGPGVAALAALNSPSQAVVSGHCDAVERAVALLQQGAGAVRLRKAVPLPVSAPFHCALMGPAAVMLREALADVSISESAWPLFVGCSGEPTTQPLAIKEALVAGVTLPVLWARSVGAAAAEEAASAGAGLGPLMVELGGNGACAALTKQCVKGASVLPCGTPEDVAAVAAALP
jgi:[acyl-carrier-protein] S-malonyltransferase